MIVMLLLDAVAVVVVLVLLDGPLAGWPGGPEGRCKRRELVAMSLLGVVVLVTAVLPVDVALVAGVLLVAVVLVAMVLLNAYVLNAVVLVAMPLLGAVVLVAAVLLVGVALVTVMMMVTVVLVTVMLMDASVLLPVLVLVVLLETSANVGPVVHGDWAAPPGCVAESGAGLAQVSRPGGRPRSELDGLAIRIRLDVHVALDGALVEVVVCLTGP